MAHDTISPILLRTDEDSGKHRDINSHVGLVSGRYMLVRMVEKTQCT